MASTSPRRKPTKTAPAPEWLTHAHLDPMRSGAMRITGFSSAIGESLVVEAIAMHRLSVVRELYTFGPGASATREADGHVESRNLVSYENIFERVADQGSTQRVRCRVARGDKLALDVLGRRVAVEMAMGKVSPRIVSAKHAKRIEWLTPSRVLLYQLCEGIPREVLFAAPGELRKRAKLDPAAQPLFRFDEWECPLAPEPLSSSPDVIAMARALAATKPLTRLTGTPSSTWQTTLDRVLAASDPKDAEQWTTPFDLRD